MVHVEQTQTAFYCVLTLRLPCDNTFVVVSSARSHNLTQQFDVRSQVGTFRSGGADVSSTMQALCLSGTRFHACFSPGASDLFGTRQHRCSRLSEDSR